MFNGLVRCFNLAIRLRIARCREPMLNMKFLQDFFYLFVFKGHTIVINKGRRQSKMRNYIIQKKVANCFNISRLKWHRLYPLCKVISSCYDERISFRKRKRCIFYDIQTPCLKRSRGSLSTKFLYRRLNKNSMMLTLRTLLDKVKGALLHLSPIVLGKYASI